VIVHHDKFLIIEPTRCTNFSILFWNETLHVSDSSSVHHQEYSTVHTAMVYVVQFRRQLASRIRTSWSCSQAVSKPVWHVPLLCVQWKTPDDGQRYCLKHVDFHSETKFSEINASGWFCYKKITGSFCENVLKWRYTKLCSELHSLYKCLLIVVSSLHYYCTQCLEKHR
jgi:hypothetical protein